MRIVATAFLFIAALPFSKPAASQTAEPFLEKHLAAAIGVTADEYQAVCAAVPRACEISKKNLKYSWTGSRQIKGLNVKEWKAACATGAKLPLCAMPENERTRWMKESKAGKVCAMSMMWIPEICEKLAAGKIDKGMTRRMILASWGDPETVYADGEGNEEWVYGHIDGFGGREAYLFFEGMILKSFGETRYKS